MHWLRPSDKPPGQSTISGKGGSWVKLKNAWARIAEPGHGLYLIVRFKLLPSLLEEFCRINPTSRFCFESNQEGQFDRAFLSHPHIISNIRGAFKKNIPGDMELVMYRLQAAETEEAFIGILATLASTHPKIAEYIQTIRPEYWTMHPAAVHHVKMYGWRTTNFVESTNGAAVPARHKFPFQFFKDFMEQFMRNAYKAQVSSDKWIDQGLIVTPYANKMIEEQCTAAGFHTVLPSTQGKAFVRDTRGNFGQHRVNIEEKICTCSYMRQFGLPCRHYIAALIKFKSLSKLYDACDACYFVKGYAAGYGCGTDQGIELVL
ncbi:hypothetical protein BBJ28_00026487 [Nothophytophthora sp. Chile5]|nr:hypothetical protein BBJ28_00026487 [Nothophytophthora sp. Chile5]